MSERKLVLRSVLARMGCIDCAGINRKVKAGAVFAHAMVGKHIDCADPVIQQWLRERKLKKPKVRLHPDKWLDDDDAPVVVAPKTLGDGDIEPPKNPDQFMENILQMTIGDFIAQFGTHARAAEWIKSMNGVETFRERRLKNQEREGKLISRDIVERGIIAPFDTAHSQLLSDAPTTIVARCFDLCASGEDKEVAQVVVQKILEKGIRNCKRDAQRALKGIS